MAMSKKDVKKSVYGMLVPAGLFIGMGVGALFDVFLPGLFLGLGVGILAAFLFAKKK